MRLEVDATTRRASRKQTGERRKGRGGREEDELELRFELCFLLFPYTR